MMRVADYMIERLYALGVKHLFLVTGRGILFLSDAAARHKELKSICVHHEQAASFAAMAYTQCNETIGACLVSTGCAATNALTGLLCAWQDDVPCVFVSGQNKLAQTTRFSGIPLRTFGQQEADIISLVSPITKYAVMITDPGKIGYEMDKAFFMAQSGRNGPVWIDVPLDIQNMRVAPEKLERFVPDTHVSCFNPQGSDIEYAIDCFENAQRPVLLIGSGVRSSSGALAQLEAFVEMFPVPVTFTASAADVYGEANKLSMGAVGSIGGTRAGNMALQNADLLIALGSRLSPITTGETYSKFARKALIIAVDIDNVEHSKNTVKIDRLIVSDAGCFLKALGNRGIRPADPGWIDKCLHWKQVFPKCEEKYKQSEKVDLHYLAACLSRLLPEKGVLITDAGLEELIIPSTVSFGKSQRCIHPASQGAMGYALPAAIGVYYAHGTDIIAVIGDGSIMMNLQELQTIKYNKIPVKILVVNNNVYSVIRTRQQELFRTRTIGTDPGNGVSCPDFENVARCFDIPYLKIGSSSELFGSLEHIIKTVQGPLLCEIIARPDQEYLHSAYAHNKDRKIVSRPLEDQAPFMDRELFLSEMVIDPIDQ
ncbi:thiamine pyrophosphate-binding protein [Desulfobacter vibrioformis]|uniref:thiamine pyrophosphate-binding protein n=1 Tax=Desulfobacter vibrioformis TaxID=34031 RepID=UPI0005504DAF|nr:thiamine pyrophosphate-binding protein [Desulfobacter vibrioformis]